MKKMKQSVCCLVIIVSMVFSNICVPDVYAEEYEINVDDSYNSILNGTYISARCLDNNTIKIKVYESDVKSIFREEYESESFKKIKKRTKKKLTVKNNTVIDKTVKKGKAYRYYIKNGSEKIFVNCYIGLSTPKVTIPQYNKSYIPVQIDTDNEGLVPDGYIIYRSEDGKNYKKIKKLKAKGVSRILFKDKKITKNKKYWYYAQSYKKIGNNITTSSKAYCKKGNKIVSANSTPKIIYDISKTENEKEYILKLESDKKNGYIYLENDIYPIVNAEESYSSKSKNLISYSYNNVDWEKIGIDDIELKPGKAVYLKIRMNNNYDILVNNCWRFKCDFAYSYEKLDELCDYTHTIYVYSVKSTDKMNPLAITEE